jgi:diadenosine tetraphosphate (Ap4A) HIT family hydrolase
MDARCALCRALADGRSATSPRAENTRLLETERFIVVPALGPFVPNHLMVVSREHVLSLAAMDSAAIVEYEELAKRLATYAPFRDAGVLEAEHGATDGDKAGACVVHTHVHWLPGLGGHSTMFDGWLTLNHESSNLDPLLGTRGPYIFTRGNFGKVRIYNASGQHSQMIRRALCDGLQRDDTNWKQFPRKEWIEETVASWPKE